LSSPHTAPLQLQVTLPWHWPALQLSPSGHVPHEPPQPLSPHSRPVQLGVHTPPGTHWPLALHVVWPVHVPHDTPQSVPHCMPTQQSGWLSSTQLPLVQISSPPHAASATQLPF